MEEAFTGGELGRPVGQDRKVGRGPIKLMHRNVEYVFGDTQAGFLVEVVTNPGAVREKMLDAHLITDQRKIRTEHVAGRRIQGKNTLLDRA